MVLSHPPCAQSWRCIAVMPVRAFLGATGHIRCWPAEPPIETGECASDEGRDSAALRTGTGRGRCAPPRQSICRGNHDSDEVLEALDFTSRDPGDLDAFTSTIVEIVS